MFRKRKPNSVPASGNAKPKTGKSMPRRQALGAIAAGLATGAMAGQAAEAQERVNRPAIQPRQPRRAARMLGRVPRRTFSIDRGMRGPNLQDRLTSLLQDDLRIDPDRVQTTIELVQTVMGDINVQQTGLLSIRMGDLVNNSVMTNDDSCGMLCNADQCDQLSCSGNACEGHTCDSQACSTHSCSGQACDQNGCHQETTSVMAQNAARSAWDQMAVLREMHSQLDQLFIEIEHTQVAQVRQFQLR